MIIPVTYPLLVKSTEVQNQWLAINGTYGDLPNGKDS